MGDRRVGRPGGDDVEHLTLPRRQRGQRRSFAVDGDGAQHAAGDLAAEDRITGGDSADGTFDLRLFGALQQVSTGTGPQGVSDQRVLVEHGEDENRGLRVALHDPPRGLNSVHARHAQIHDDHIWPAEADLAYRLFAGSRLSDDLDALERVEQCREPTPDDWVVVGQQDPDGRRVRRLGGRHDSIMRRLRRSVWGPGPTCAGTFPGPSARDSGYCLRR
jgi:hypothetical protein